MKPIAYIHTDFPTKFGVPRQSGLVDELVGRIVFEPEYRQPEAFRGIEEYSYLWLIWEFSESKRDKWSATVKPPRLGGKVRMGVFATRSPFRPNPIGLSCVRLIELQEDEKLGPVLVVAGIDMMDGTPIYDIKPYLPYVDAHPDADGGFGARVKEHALAVEFPRQLLSRIPQEKQRAAIRMLEQDPRPAATKPQGHIYKVEFAGRDIHFTVIEHRLCVTDVL